MTTFALSSPRDVCLRRSIWTLIVMAGWLGFAANHSDASVKGQAYAGGFVTNLGFPAVITLDFGTDGSLILWENGILFGGTYVGDFTEINIGGITYWQSFMPDESPDGFADLSGLSVFGLLTTYHNHNLDQSGITVDGFLIRTGSVP